MSDNGWDLVRVRSSKPGEGGLTLRRKLDAMDLVVLVATASIVNGFADCLRVGSDRAKEVNFMYGVAENMVDSLDRDVKAGDLYPLGTRRSRSGPESGPRPCSSRATSPMSEVDDV